MVRSITAADDAAVLRAMVAAPEFVVNYASMTAAEMIDGWDQIVADVRRDVDAGNRAGLVAFGKLAANLLSHDHDRNFYALVVEYLRAAVETLGQSPGPVPAAPKLVAAPAAPVVTNISGIPDGYYTAVLGDGSHVTLRIANGKWSKNPDFRKIGLLVGPCNTGDYLYVGFTFADGNVKLKEQYRGDGRIAEAIRVIAGDPTVAGKGYALESGNCYRCNRLLTTPESVAAGIGPVCSGRE